MKLTEKDKSILIGLLLGNGYINDKGKIIIMHKLKDYCIYKAKLLHSVCGGKDIKVHEYIRNYSILKDGKQIKLSNLIMYGLTRQSKSFLPIREMLYNKETKKKYLSKDVLKYITPEVIALWWLDNGYLTKDNTLRLRTSLSKEQNKLILKFFLENYNIKWSVVKHNSLWILQCEENEKFLNLIKVLIFNTSTQHPIRMMILSQLVKW